MTDVQPAIRDLREVVAACDAVEAMLSQAISAQRKLVAMPGPDGVIVEAELRFQAARMGASRSSIAEESEFFSDLARRYAAAADMLWGLTFMRIGESLTDMDVRDIHATAGTVGKLTRYHRRRLKTVGPAQQGVVQQSVEGADTAIDGAGKAVAFTEG